VKSFIIFLFFTFQAHAQYNCGPGLMRTWTPGVGYGCSPRVESAPSYQQNLNCFYTGVPTGTGSNNFYQSFNTAINPWWANQGELYYPNMRYPGAWSWPGIQSSYYPGQGEIFAAKPNVYVETIFKDKKFEFKFTSEEKLSFLVTTPLLINRTWRGKLVDNSKFEVDESIYDYLFYDIRLPQEKMQFDQGVCTTRDGVIEWMLEDLNFMSYPSIAKQDFEEHWRVKIPDYPFYCAYPQYNKVLDAALPVTINLPQTTFTRVLYILVPHKKSPDFANLSSIPYPTSDPSASRPSTKIKRENMFREWGVAFIGN
jgi:hypothetical protein